MLANTHDIIIIQACITSLCYLAAKIKIRKVGHTSHQPHLYRREANHTGASMKESIAKMVKVEWALHWK